MKKIIAFKFLFIVLILFSTCRTDEISEKEVINQKENEVLNKIEKIVPTQILYEFENHLNDKKESPNYHTYLDSFNVAVDELIFVIENNYSKQEFQNAFKSVNDNFGNLKSATSENNKGWGYAKGLEIDSEIGAELGFVAYGGVEGGIGLGYTMIYDFVNLDRQAYLYSICEYGYKAGLGLGIVGGELSAGLSGFYELVTGIPYQGQQPIMNKFNGPSLGKSYSLNFDIAALAGGAASVGIGSSIDAYSEKTGFVCANKLTKINNGTKSYMLSGGVGLSASLGAKLSAALESEKAGTYLKGLNKTYKTYLQNGRKIGALKMAKNILIKSPLECCNPVSYAFDITASALAIKYSFNNYSDQVYDVPSLGTLETTEITSSTAVSGGVITYNGGKRVTSKGIVWNKDGDPTLSNCDGFTSDGAGDGKYSSYISNLQPKEKYYIRAYATNEAGTIYGFEEKFKTKAEDIIDDVPDEVNEFLSNEDIEILEENGLIINKGLNPPNVEGNYFCNSMENQITGTHYIDYSYKFYNQTSSLKISMKSAASGSISEGDGAFISGDEDKFSVYLSVYTENESRSGDHIIKVWSADIYSGTITNSGIKDFQIGFIILDKENDKENELMDIGDYRIIFEADGIAEKVYTFPYSSNKNAVVKKLKSNISK